MYQCGSPDQMLSDIEAAVEGAISDAETAAGDAATAVEAATGDAVDEILLDLQEDAEAGDAGDDGGVFVADVVLEEGEDFNLAKFVLGVFGAALGEADVFAEGD